MTISPNTVRIVFFIFASYCLLVIVLFASWNIQILSGEINRILTRRATQVATWIFGIGLTFFAFRALELPLLGMRLWLYLSVLALIVAAGLGLWYRLARYPAALARYQQEQARQQYLRPSQPAKVRRSSAGRRRR
jgi:hypothetical protein